MAEIVYSPEILLAYARRLYAQARFMIFTTAVKYGIVTFVVVAGLTIAADFVSHTRRGPQLWPAGIIAAVGAFVGSDAGQRKAFLLKLEAQKILCQREIEINTRSTAKQESIKPVAGQ